MQKINVSKTQAPSDVLAALLDGKVLYVNGHRIEYDREQEITWYTNPYGVDGVLCQIPNMVSITKFMGDMAQGIGYGLLSE